MQPQLSQLLFQIDQELLSRVMFVLQLIKSLIITSLVFTVILVDLSVIYSMVAAIP